MQCDKLGYKTNLDAHNHIKGINKRKGGSYKSYKCDECGLFHVTTVKAKKLINKGTGDSIQFVLDTRHPVNLKKEVINPIPKRSRIEKSIVTTYKPFEHLNKFKFKK